MEKPVKYKLLNEAHHAALRDDFNNMVDALRATGANADYAHWAAAMSINAVEDMGWHPRTVFNYKKMFEKTEKLFSGSLFVDIQNAMALPPVPVKFELPKVVYGVLTDEQYVTMLAWEYVLDYNIESTIESDEMLAEVVKQAELVIREAVLVKELWPSGMKKLVHIELMSIFPDIAEGLRKADVK